jgi:hypothetical protein
MGMSACRHKQRDDLYLNFQELKHSSRRNLNMARHNVRRIESVQLRDNGTPIGSVTSLPDGSWSYTSTGLSPGQHVFTAHVGNTVSNQWTVNVQDDQMNLVRPNFKNATAAGGNRQEINYYAHEGDGFVQIPDYHAQVGDTVRVSWAGRRITINSETQTVVNPAVGLEFKISMYELIDCIGVNATITYTVGRGGQVYTSDSLILSVSGHVGAIEAPTINSPTNNNIRVQFREGYYTAQIRFIGINTVESAIREFHGDYINFTIDAAWADQNRGLPVLFNYSLKRFDDSKIYYSQVLRVNNLRSAPADAGIAQADP